MDVLSERHCAPWVRACYVDKFRRYMGDEFAFMFEPKGGPELSRIVSILRRIPEGPSIAAEHMRGLESQLGNRELPAADRDNLTTLLELAKAAARPNP